MINERSKYSTKVVVTDDQDMSQTLAADAAKKPLADAVAVRRGRWRFDDGGATAACHAIEDTAELAIVVSEQVPRSVLEGDRLSKLLSSSLVRRISSYVEMDDFAAVEAYDEEREYGTEGEVVELKESQAHVSCEWF